MTVRPILFSAPMVRALLAGTKTQTRRVASSRDGTERLICPRCGMSEREWKRGAHDGPECEGSLDWLPVDPIRFRVGDRLWVRETWRPDPNGLEPDGGIDVRYAADGTRRHLVPAPGWRLPKAAQGGQVPGMYLPRWASRLILDVTAVRVERLQDITRKDAEAEGLSAITKDNGRVWKWGIPDRDGLPGTDNDGWPWHEWDVDPRLAYRRLWDSLNAGRGFGWAANPWVVAVTFGVVRGNIDA